MCEKWCWNWLHSFCNEVGKMWCTLNSTFRKWTLSYWPCFKLQVMDVLNMVHPGLSKYRGLVYHEHCEALLTRVGSLFNRETISKVNHLSLFGTKEGGCKGFFLEYLIIQSWYLPEKCRWKLRLLYRGYSVKCKDQNKLNGNVFLINYIMSLFRTSKSEAKKDMEMKTWRIRFLFRKWFI